MPQHLPNYTKTLIPFARKLRRDAKRDAYLRSDGLNVLRILNDEVLSNEAGGEQVIYEQVQAELKRKQC